jgi:hypothetical protein
VPLDVRLSGTRARRALNSSPSCFVMNESMPFAAMPSMRRIPPATRVAFATVTNARLWSSLTEPA